MRIWEGLDNGNLAIKVLIIGTLEGWILCPLLYTVSTYY